MAEAGTDTLAAHEKKRQFDALCAEFPLEDIKTREQGGQTLYYLDGYTVLQRLNDVMQGNYEFEIGQVITGERTVDVSGKLTLHWSDGSKTVVSDFGSSDILCKADGKRVNDPYKSAVKDLYKRCLAAVGVGAQLYDDEYRAGIKVRLEYETKQRQDKEFLTCQGCAGEIQGGDITGRDGKPVTLTARQVAESTRTKFKKRLCIKCASAAREQ